MIFAVPPDTPPIKPLAASIVAIDVASLLQVPPVVVLVNVVVVP